MSWPAYYQSNALYAEYSAINISVYQKIFRLFFGLSNEEVHQRIKRSPSFILFIFTTSYT